MSADRFEIPHYADYVIIGQRNVFHIHDRRSETAMYQHISDIVHVCKAVDMRVFIRLPESLAQLFQRIWTERAEHEQTVDLEDAMNLGNGLLEVIAPLQRQI